MDKNIKAELSALKNEIIDKINNLEKRIFADSISTRYEPDPTFFSDNSPLGRHLIKEAREMSRLKNIVEDTFHQEEFKQVYNEIKDRVHAIHHSSMFPLDENYVDNRKPSLEYNILNTLKKIDEEIPITQEDVIKADVEHFTELIGAFNRLDKKVAKSHIDPSTLNVSSNVNIDEDLPEIVENNKKVNNVDVVTDKVRTPKEIEEYSASLIDTTLMKNEITRIKNSDTRTIYYIDVGKMSPDKAKENIAQLTNEIHQRRIPSRDPSGQSILDAPYNPLTNNYYRPSSLSQPISESLNEQVNHYKETDAAKDEVRESVNVIEDLKIEKKELLTSESYPGTKYVRPDWLTDVGNKPMEQLMKEIRKWDETSQEMFVEAWNNDFNRRYDILNSTLTTFILCIAGYSPGKVSVASVDDAKEALHQYELAEQMKKNIIDVVNNKDRVVLDQLKAHKTSLGFTLYYKWLNELVDEILELDNSKEIKILLNEKKPNLKLLITGADRALILYAIDTLRQMIDDHELDMFELKLIDPATFEWAKIPADRQKAYKQLSYTNYKKDLTNAYKFIAEQDTLVKKAVDDDKFENEVSSILKAKFG